RLRPREPGTRPPAAPSPAAPPIALPGTTTAAWRLLRRSATVAGMEQATVNRFPPGWPPGCPPTDAASGEGAYHRGVRSMPATAEDFRSHLELGKLPKAPACLRAGLSMFRNEGDAERMALLFPVLGSYVARGVLDARYGVSMHSPGRQPTHTTVWPYI